MGDLMKTDWPDTVKARRTLVCQLLFTLALTLASVPQDSLPLYWMLTFRSPWHDRGATGAGVV
jgi:hypothetical protein